MSVENRRTAQAKATREELIAIGYELFGTIGYSEVSSAEIVKRAHVSRGALYYHFKLGKIELFEAVARKTLSNLVANVTKRTQGDLSNWNTLRPGLEAYFEATMTDKYCRIALQDAPYVLGVERWRKLEYTSSARLIQISLEQLIQNQVIRPIPVKPLVSLIFGACCEATLTIAASSHREKAKQETLDAMMILLSGIRM